MEEKKDLAEEGEVEGTKREIFILDFQGPLPGGKLIAPLRGDAALPITMECLPKGSEPVEDEGESSLLVDVATVEATQLLLLLGRVVRAEEEWGAGVVETFVHLLLVATKMSPGEMGLLLGMDKIALSITRPGLEIEVRLGVRGQNMRKSPREEGSGGLRLAVTVLAVTLVTQTRMRSRNPTPKMALTMSSQLVTCHLPHQEVPRRGSSRPGVYLPEEEGVEAVEGETSTAEAAMLEWHLEVIE